MGTTDSNSTLVRLSNFLGSRHKIAYLKKSLAERGLHIFSIKASFAALVRSNVISIVNSDHDQRLDQIATKISFVSRSLDTVDPQGSCSSRLIADVCNMAMDPSIAPNPFKPMLILSTGVCSFSTENLTIEDLSILSKTYEQLSNKIVKARIADVIWTCSRKRDSKIAIEAIENYLSLSLEREGWHQNIDICVRRGLVLAKITKSHAQISMFENRISATLIEWSSKPDSAHLGIFEVVSEFQLCASQHLVVGKTCAEIGKKRLLQKKFVHACAAYELAADFVRKQDRALHFDYLKNRADAIRSAANEYMYKVRQYPAAEHHYSLASVCPKTVNRLK